jgi:hypothetical protein
MIGIYANHPLDDEQRRALLFEGNLLLYSCADASRALAEHAAAMIADAFRPHRPQHAQFALEVSEFVKVVGPLKTRFTNDLRTKELVRELLRGYGCDVQMTYFDVPRLRVVPAGGYLTSGVSYAYKAHRDIWYASPRSQVNWWMPVFPVTAQRAMSFFPEYWSRPVANSSADFDYAEWCAVGRRQAVAQVGEDARKHPLPLEEIDLRSELRVAGNTGEIILFAASHLHATAPNTSGLTRFSIDFRTVNLQDLRTQAGGPNIDSRATGSTLGDFLRAADFAPLQSVPGKASDAA